MKSIIIFFIFLIQFKLFAQNSLIDSIFSIGQLKIIENANQENWLTKPEINNEGYVSIEGDGNEYKILCLKTGNDCFIQIGNNKHQLRKGLPYYFEIKNEDKVFMESINPLQKPVLNNLSAFVPPEFYTIYSYSRMFRHNGIGRQNLNFFIHFYVKNFTGNRKNFTQLNQVISIIDLKSSKEVLNILFKGGKKKKFEGWIYIGKNDLELSHVLFWDHENPNLYLRKFKLWTGENSSNVQENESVIGFRDVNLKMGNLYVNDKRISVRSYYLPAKTNTITDSTLYFFKKNHINCLILGEKVQSTVYDYCDSLGIYVVQLVNDSLFPNLKEWFDYHTLIKEHPSLIGWFDSGTESKLIEIIKEVDHNRLIFNNQNFFFPIYQGFDLDNKLVTKCLGRILQPINFYLNGTDKKMIIQFIEYSKYIEKLNLEIDFLNLDLRLIKQQTIQLNNKKNENTVEIDLENQISSIKQKQFLVKCKLVFKEKTIIYKKGEVYAHSRFKVTNNGSFILAEEVTPILPSNYIAFELN